MPRLLPRKSDETPPFCGWAHNGPENILKIEMNFIQYDIIKRYLK